MSSIEYFFATYFHHNSSPFHTNSTAFQPIFFATDQAWTKFISPSFIAMKIPKILEEIDHEESILFIKAEQNYSIFHLENGDKLTSAYTLKHYENHLHRNNFVRLSRAFLVHRSFVQEIRKQTNSSYAVLKNGSQILISRRRLQNVIKTAF